MKTTTIILIGAGAFVVLYLVKKTSTTSPGVLPASGIHAPSNIFDLAIAGVTSAANSATSIFSSTRNTPKPGTQADGSFSLDGSRAVSGDGDVLGGGDDNSIDA